MKRIAQEIVPVRIYISDHASQNEIINFCKKFDEDSGWSLKTNEPVEKRVISTTLLTNNSGMNGVKDEDYVGAKVDFYIDHCTAVKTRNRVGDLWSYNIVVTGRPDFMEYQHDYILCENNILVWADVTIARRDKEVIAGDFINEVLNIMNNGEEENDT